MKKIVTIVGARPQFIKAAVVSRALAKHDVEEVMIHTGQHYDDAMSAVFFEELEISEPKYNLAINSKTTDTDDVIGEMTAQIAQVLVSENADLVLVYGDTNSTLAGAMAAKHTAVPVAHVEAGLRSFNNAMPEEFNRVTTDFISTMLFCPSDQAITNLTAEGIVNSSERTVVRTGDVMYDSALFCKSKIVPPAGIEPNGFVLATIHRQENTDKRENLESILEGLDKINDEMPVIWPRHPRSKKAMEEFGLSSNVKMIDPVGYLEMISLLSNCKMVVTDSGGLQKEAYFFKKMCVTARAETEWVELVENGYNTLVASNGDNMFAAFNSFLSANKPFDEQLYGDGKAGEVIAQQLVDYVNSKS